MKLTTLFAAAAAGLFLSSVSCERHDWDEVKKLHEPHGAHGAGHGEHAEHSGEKHEGGEKHTEEHGKAPEHKPEH